MPEPIEDACGRRVLEIPVRTFLSGWIQPVPCHRHQSHQVPPVARQGLIIPFSEEEPETFIDQPYDMESVQHSHGVRKPLPDKAAVCPVHIHADNPDPVPARGDIEDPAVPEITERGGKAVPLGEAVAEAFHRGGTDAVVPCDC